MRYFRPLLALALILPSTLAGQSLMASSGLGMRLEPLDAVQRALGGMGVTTRAPAVLPGNPLAALDLLAPSITFTVQPQWGQYEIEAQRGNFYSTRFPVLGFAYPLGTDAVLTLTAGSQFDQNWAVESRTYLDVGGQSVGLTDTFISDGALTAVQVGWARRWSPTLAFGATLGVYRGGLIRTFTRAFDLQASDSVALDNLIAPFIDGGRWAHSGPLASLNVSWDPSPVLQVGVTVGWGGTVKVKPAEGAEGVSRNVSVPLEFKVSTIAVLNPSLSLNVGFSSANWTDLGDPSLDDVAGGRVMSYGAGLEWERISFWAGGLPLRVGFRQSDLPFLFLGNKVRERAISFGLSIVMVEALELPLAAVDVAFESGSRDSGGFSETFQRLTVTTRVGGR
jgi:hypothetical protein